MSRHLNKNEDTGLRASESDNHNMSLDRETKSLWQRLREEVALCDPRSSDSSKSVSSVQSGQKSTEDGPSGEEQTATGNGTSSSSPLVNFEDFLNDLPSPPSKSPVNSNSSSNENQDLNDAVPLPAKYGRFLSYPISNFPSSDHGKATGKTMNEGEPRSVPLSTTSSYDSFTWSSASCDLPNPLTFLWKEQTLIPPLEVSQGQSYVWVSASIS